MRDIIQTARCGDLAEHLWPLASRVKVKAGYWISTPDGDGGDWCADCGYFKVRNLRRRDPTRRGDYFLDGGWRTEHDHSIFCSHCGERLAGSLTKYGAESEIDHYREYGVQPASSVDALYLYEILNALEWTDARDAWLADEAADIAEALLWSAA